MRFAGQRFRIGRFTEGHHSAPSGYVPDMNYRYQAQGLPPSMATMSEINAAQFSKTGEPTHGEPDFVHAPMGEPEFRI